MTDKPSIPEPQYNLIQVLHVCLALGRRAIDEGRALADDFRALATELREFVRIPGPEGKRGQKGDDGQKGDRGEQGKEGPRGRDGIGPADIEQIDEPTEYGHRFKSNGQVVAEHRWQKPKAQTLADSYRGIWKEGEYKRGDTVTRDGSLWLNMAEADTTGIPGASPDWKLIVKRGQNGKDGRDGDRGPEGKKGDKGDAGPRGYGG